MDVSAFGIILLRPTFSQTQTTNVSTKALLDIHIDGVPPASTINLQTMSDKWLDCASYIERTDVTDRLQEHSMEFVIFLISLAAIGSSETSQPAMTVAEVNAMAKRVRSFAPKDEFDAPPSQSSVADRSFTVEVQPWGSNSPPIACFGYPMWSYASSSQTLYVSIGSSDLLLSTFRSRQGAVTKKSGPEIWGETIQYFASDCARSDLPRYSASNAYGAEFKIEPTLQTITAIADALPKESEWPSSFKISTSGGEARALVPNLRVRFTGALSDWKPGVSVACGSRRDGPTASSPYDRTLDLCLYNGRIDRIELLDMRSGKVLDTFIRPE